MSKVDIKRLDSVTKNDTTATEQINDNFQALQAAIENTVSRDGTVPNYMDADLDLNSYRIINAGDPVNKQDVVTLEYFEEKAGGAIEAAAEAKASASKAASSAQSALVASNNAIGQLAQAEGLLTAAETQLEETRTYVEEAVTDIAEIRDDAVETVDKAVADALDGVKKEAVDAATNVIDSVVGQYTGRAEAAANNAEADATNAAESATLAAEDANDAAHWAEDARIWAVGSDTEVNTIAPNQGKHSAETYASMAATSANLAEIKNKITNCITEIPQDIKLGTDSNGKTWLKAGSKCYKPDGTVVNITSDLAVGRTSTGQEFVGVSGDGSRVALYVNPSRCYSGTTAPTGFSGYGLWLDTTNKVFKYSTDGGATWTAGDYCFPFAIATMKNVAGEVASIDQVFNGFGYIGSTVFALPGVKGLIPDGRNADGSLRNLEFTVSKVLTYTYSVTLSNAYMCIVGDSGQATSLNYRVINGTPTSGWYYNEEKNIYTYNGAVKLWVDYGTISTSSGVVSNFAPKLPFRAVDQNDFNKLDEEVTTLDAQSVKLTGNQTIGGVKTFTNNIINVNNSDDSVALYSKDLTADSTVIPKVLRRRSYRILDKNGLILGDFRTERNTSGTQTSSMLARNKLTGSEVTGTISITVDASGNVYTYAPTPASTRNDTTIATTAWVTKRIPAIMNNPTNVTTLWQGTNDGSDMALSEPFTNFEQIRVYYTNDESQRKAVVDIPTASLNEILTQDISVYLLQGANMWVLKNYASGSSTSYFKHAYDNCRIIAIKGINRK